MIKSDVTYDFYINQYCGGSKNLLGYGDFNVYVSRAKNFLNGVFLETEPEGAEDKVKYAICAVAEELCSHGERGNVKSETIDGYSVTFDSQDKINKRLMEIASLYLGDCGMAFLGVE